jgi:hypothetical protein
MRFLLSIALRYVPLLISDGKVISNFLLNLPKTQINQRKLKHECLNYTEIHKEIQKGWTDHPVWISPDILYTRNKNRKKNSVDDCVGCALTII